MVNFLSTARVLKCSPIPTSRLRRYFHLSGVPLATSQHRWQRSQQVRQVRQLQRLLRQQENELRLQRLQQGQQRLRQPLLLQQLLLVRDAKSLYGAPPSAGTVDALSRFPPQSLERQLQGELEELRGVRKAYERNSSTGKVSKNGI